MLILVNLGGLALAAGFEGVAVIVLGSWLLDMVLRVVTLVRSRRARPTASV